MALQDAALLRKTSPASVKIGLRRFCELSFFRNQGGKYSDCGAICCQPAGLNGSHPPSDAEKHRPAGAAEREPAVSDVKPFSGNKDFQS